MLNYFNFYFLKKKDLKTVHSSLLESKEGGKKWKIKLCQRIIKSDENISKNVRKVTSPNRMVINLSM